MKTLIRRILALIIVVMGMSNGSYAMYGDPGVFNVGPVITRALTRDANIVSFRHLDNYILSHCKGPGLGAASLNIGYVIFFQSWVQFDDALAAQKEESPAFQKLTRDRKSFCQIHHTLMKYGVMANYVSDTLSVCIVQFLIESMNETLKSSDYVITVGDETMERTVTLFACYLISQGWPKELAITQASAGRLPQQQSLSWEYVSLIDAFTEAHYQKPVQKRKVIETAPSRLGTSLRALDQMQRYPVSFLGHQSMPSTARTIVGVFSTEVLKSSDHCSVDGYFHEK